MSEHHNEDERRLPFFANPVAKDKDHSTSHFTILSQRGHDEERPKEGDVEVHDDNHKHKLQFKYHHEARPIELFYDLFFVANLTTFTAHHNINTMSALSQYIGFFCILWFTWYQVTLYDVRFSHDSLFDRVSKACQLGVMVGFSIVGSRFENDFTKEDADPVSFRALTLILMVSRLILAAQYASTLWCVRKYREAYLPFLTTIAYTLVAAVIYLGLFWSFKGEQKNRSYIAWYIIAIMETLATMTVASVWPVAGFKGTHIGERMSLLTLIILGEGIILLMKAISYLVEGNWVWDSPTIGSVVCSILIIYFFFMIYFDRLQAHHFGKVVRRQIWSFLHFPLHIALVLALEGTRQLVIWGQAIRIYTWQNTEINNEVTQKVDPSAEFPFQNAATALAQWAQDYVFSYIKDYTDSSVKAAEAFSQDLGVFNTTTDPEVAQRALSSMQIALWDLNIATLGVKLPKKKGSSGDKSYDSAATEQAMVDLFYFIFTYFFVVTGIAVMLSVVIGYVARPPKSLAEWARGGATFVVGIGIALLATMSLSDSERIISYEQGPWVLPTVVLALFLAAIVNHVKH